MRSRRMEGRRMSCRGCGLQLTVPPAVQIIRCSRCRKINYIQSAEPFGRVHDPFIYGAEWVKGFLANVCNTNISINYPPPPLDPLPTPISYLPLAVTGGNKRALLCGVSYKERRYELKGSINDVNCMRYFLIQKLGFPYESVRVLTEEEPNKDQIPTKRNIQMALQWLISDCKKGDSLVFHYSGHGSQQRNLSGDEIDGYDETICPLDYQTEGMILDDEINATIVRPLPRGATLHAIIDACHSGTVLDLPFVYKINRDRTQGSWQDQRCPSGVYKGTKGGLALCFSACDDHQTSADTNIFSKNIMQGAMTYSFIRAVENKGKLTYGELLDDMRTVIRDVNAGRFNGPIASLIKKIFRIHLSQEPQLSSSEQFDIYEKQFAL